MAIILLTQGEKNVFVDTVKVNGVQNNIGPTDFCWVDKNKQTDNLFKISSFLFRRRKQAIQVSAQWRE